MKHKFLLKAMLLLCALVAGSSSVWAGTVTRTENFASSSASSNAYNCSSNATTSGMQDNWDYAWSPSGSVYVFQSGIRLGKSNGTGSVANTTMLSGISTGTSITIKVYAARWNTDTGNLTVTYNGNSESKAPANSAITDTSAEYSSSDFSTSTNFSITKAEDVTSFTIASSAKRIFIDKVEVIYDDGPAKLANDLAWSAASKSVTYSETPYGLPTLTNPHSLAIEYASTNESVATVASDGTVTIKNVTGSTTISAHTDGDATYAAGTVSYTLNVTRKVILEDGVFNFGFGEDYGSGMTEGTTLAVNEETWTSGNITMDVAGRNCWYTGGSFRLYKENGGDAAGSVTLNCPAGKAITRIDFTGPYTGTGALSNMTANTGTFTVTSSSAIWTGAAQSVTFTTGSSSTYINTITVTYGTTVPVTIASSGYSTIARDFGLNFSAATPVGLEAYVASAVSASAVTLTAVDEVPASTGVILKGTAGETYTIPVKAAATFDGTNKLKAAVTATDVAANEVYILKGGKFCKVTGASTVPAGKAYLLASDVPASAPELMFVFGGEVTGVNEVSEVKEVNDNSWYNLAGQRVAQPSKGLYIVNGKKVVIK